MIAIIPARAGSRSIPGKNHRVIAGRPLVAWAIRAALESREVSQVVVTTDDPRVASLAQTLGATVHDRSAATATETASTESVLHEVVEDFDASEYVLLQATSPLTTAADVDAAIRVFRQGSFDSVVSVAPQWRFVWIPDGDGGRPWNYDPQHRPRRQDAEPLLVENGAIYVFTTKLLKQHESRLGGRIGLYHMSPATYHELDEPEDWLVVERHLRGRRCKSEGWKQIKLVLTDVDGVLTDNGMYWSSDGSEFKKFSARDGKGFELLHKAGLKTALITSEAREFVAARGAKLGVYHVELGCKDKLGAAQLLCEGLGLTLAEAAFIGDDVHDLELLLAAGLALAPADAVAEILDAVDYVLATAGGRGCFREVADLLLEGRS